jgi:uncharacterized protein (TIGR03663 family)
MQNQDNPSFLERSLVELLKPSWEKAIYFVIFLLAVASRFWDLGARAMSHDESLHALYSYYLYNGTGYAHNPMMHGPFLFHANALIYFLFGDSDYMARIVPALFGVFLVLSPLLLRRWLGRLGAIIASIMLLISPSILYYSRYIRNDVYIAVWTMLLIVALFQFMRTRKAGWFLLGAAVLMLSLATKENAYIFGFIGLAFVVEMVLWERVSQRNQLWLYLGGAVLSVLLLSIGYLLNRTPAEGVQSAAEASKSIKLVAALIIVVGGTIPAALISGSLIHPRHPQRSRIEEAIRSVGWRVWLIAAIVVFIIYALLFTTFFTNPSGLLTGVFGSISYWLAQQEVQRGGQPWYYYFLVLTMYEFVPFLFSAIAVVYYLVRGVPNSSPIDQDSLEEELFAETPADEGEPDAGFMRRQRGAALSMPAAFTGATEQSLFIAFLIFWTICSLFIYSWAGEKMPWLVVHPVLPMIILTAKFAGDLFSRVDWREMWQRGGALLALLLPVTLFGLYTLVTKQPLQGLSLSKLQETGQWFAALLVTLLLLVLTALLVRRLGGRRALKVGVGTVLLFLSFFTVRFAWMASYINYDYATELLVYAHGGADVKPTMNEIADISARTVGDKQIKVAYDNEVSWPLEWYMREYPNRVYYGDKPTRETLDVPVVLVSERNDGKVQPFLGDRYYKFKRRLVWWPNQQYMDLTWERVRNILTSPDKRQILWNILYWRKYPRSTDDWYHVHNFYFYVRKDVAQQIWDFGAMPPEVVDLAPNPYIEKHIDLNSEQVWGQVGTDPGQFNHPHGIAVGPDGNVYVVDSDNSRIQVFDPNGTFLREWGSQCNLEDGHGCVDPDGSGPLEPGDGQFQEPWGIAVAPDGHVYVADTWNHRIQVFDSSGNFITKWGQYGQTNSSVALFYGPRDVAVDASGRVFVTDTGNKRVVVFDQDGNLLYQWGGGGVLGGYFEEPVGIDVDADGNIYVADTWNQRIQVFDGDYVYLRDWPVDAWYGESVTNKPYLAVDGQGRVYATDPEGYLVTVFSSTGDLLATFGNFGYDQTSFSLPTGIAVSDAGYIYVTDTDGQRVMKFQPLLAP